ncbi:MAG TPA: peptidylprolyl isomerase [Acidimicrobiales bacterium]|nr:peptidylprolyl isomerase [Acidimicrobiales bacterium]
MPSAKRQRKREGRQYRQAQVKAAQRRRAQRRNAIRIAVVTAVALALALSLGLFSAKKSTKVSTKATTTTAAAGPPRAAPLPPGAKLQAWTCPQPGGTSPRTDQFPSTPPPLCIDPAKTYVAHLSTSEGAVDVTLDSKRTPNTANNYAVLARYHYFDGTTIDRIDNSIDILQTGSPKTQDISDSGPGYNIKDEGGKFTYSDGDVVMARSSGADSGSAQYFFVVGPKASALNAQGTYVTFGKITAGLDVLHRVEGLFQACPSDAQGCLGGAPNRIVTINKVTIEEKQ